MRNPLTMKKVLATVDLGVTSESVVEFGASIAARAGARLELLYVFPPLHTHGRPRLIVDAEDSAEQQLERLSAQARELTFDGLDVRTHTERMYTAAAIFQHAEDADLIVMGQTESYGAWRFLLGDTTGEVIENAPCPVLVVPAGLPYEEPTHFTLAVDEQLPDRAVIEPLADLAHRFAATVDIRQIGKTDTETDAARLAALVAHLPFTYDLDRSGDGVPEYLSAHRDELASGWLCLAHRRRPAWQQVMTRSLGERIAAVAPLPTLILVEPDPQRDSSAGAAREARAINT